MKQFRSPANWPTPPEGWQPPPGWQPDPKWGPAPADHQFWIDVPDSASSVDQRGKAITILALVLGGTALLLCWVPVVNNLVFFLGVLAVILGAISLAVTIRGRSTFRGMAIASLAVSILSIVGVLASQAYYQSILSSASGALRGEGSQGGTAPLVTPVAPSESADEQARPSASAAAGSSSQPLSVGSLSAVGHEYQVAVSSVRLDADEEVLAANQFNSPAAGQYVLVELSVTYTGTNEGNPWIDLSPTFVGTDARQYDAHKCGAVLNQSAMQVPTLEKGGNASYQVCMDVPPTAVAGGKIFVERTISFNDNTRVYWTTQ